MSLDRFAHGRPDAQSGTPVVAYCAACGYEIYGWEQVYDVDGEILHADPECLVKYINPRVVLAEEAIA